MKISLRSAKRVQLFLWVMVLPKLPDCISQPINVEYKNKFGILKVEINNNGEGDFEMYVGKIRYSDLSLKISAQSVEQQVRIVRKNHKQDIQI